MARRWDSIAGRALHHMKPNRVAARYLSGGKHQTFTAIAKSPVKAKTVHTPKSGRRAYQQQMARERKAATAQATRARKQAARDQKAARVQQRREQPRPPRAQKGPLAVNARTGRPVTWAEAQAAARDANWQAARIERGIGGRTPPTAPARAEPAWQPDPALTPLQAAIEQAKRSPQVRARAAAKKEAARKQAVEQRKRERAAAKRARERAEREAKRERERQRARARRERERQKRAAAKAGARRPRRSPGSVVSNPPRPAAPPAGAGRTPSPATLRPTAPAPRTSRPGMKAKPRTAQKGIYGTVMAARCPCGGTGRIPVYDPQGDPHGSTSCPVHGRRARGARRHFTRTAARDAGLPGLTGFLAKKRGKKAKRLDRHQARVAHRAMYDLRHMGPTERCPETAHCTGGVWDRKARDAEREVWIAEYVAERRATGRRIPSRRRLRVLASRALPYDHCDTCGGLGRVRTSTEVTLDGSLPIWEWRASADLPRGHRPTARERSTGRRPTRNAVAAERRRKLPRL